MNDSRIIEYKIITGSEGYLNDNVNKLLKEGYTLYGSPSMCCGESVYNRGCCQAMVKYATTDDSDNIKFNL